MAFLTKKTFEYRRGLMRRMMEANGLDALAFLTSDFFQWATNFHVDVQPWERPIVAVVPLDGEPFAIMNDPSTTPPPGTPERATMWIGEAPIYAGPPRVGSRVPVRAQWSETAADLLTAKGLGRGRIGVDAGGGPFGRVTALLPELKPVPATTGQMRRGACRAPRRRRALRLGPGALPRE